MLIIIKTINTPSTGGRIVISFPTVAKLTTADDISRGDLVLQLDSLLLKLFYIDKNVQYAYAYYYIYSISLQTVNECCDTLIFWICKGDWRKHDADVSRRENIIDLDRWYMLAIFSI